MRLMAAHANLYWRIIFCISLLWSCQGAFVGQYQLPKVQYSEQTPEVTYSCGFWSGLKPIYYLNFAAQLKRVNCDSNSNLKFPVSKPTKHGTLTLALPSKLLWTDITIHMDIQRNPGPPLAEFRSVVQTPATNYSGCIWRL